MTLQEIRKRFPQYNDLTDKELAEGLHDKYYSDLPWKDFASRIGFAETDYSKQHGGEDASFRGPIKERYADTAIRNALMGIGVLPEPGGAVPADAPGQMRPNLTDAFASRSPSLDKLIGNVAQMGQAVADKIPTGEDVMAYLGNTMNPQNFSRDVLQPALKLPVTASYMAQSGLASIVDPFLALQSKYISGPLGESAQKMRETFGAGIQQAAEAGNLSPIQQEIAGGVAGMAGLAVPWKGIYDVSSRLLGALPKAGQMAVRPSLQSLAAAEAAGLGVSGGDPHAAIVGMTIPLAMHGTVAGADIATKSRIDKGGKTTTVEIDPQRIRDILNKDNRAPDYAEEAIYKSLGLKGKAFREALKKGLKVMTTEDRIMSVKDRPWYAAIKKRLGVDPIDESVVIKGGTEWTYGDNTRPGSGDFQWKPSQEQPSAGTPYEEQPFAGKPYDEQPNIPLASLTRFSEKKTADLPSVETVKPSSAVAEAAPAPQTGMNVVGKSGVVENIPDRPGPAPIGIPTEPGDFYSSADKILNPDANANSRQFLKNQIFPHLKRMHKNGVLASSDVLGNNPSENKTLLHRIIELADAGLIEKRWDDEGNSYFIPKGTKSDLLTEEEVVALVHEKEKPADQTSDFETTRKAAGEQFTGPAEQPPSPDIADHGIVKEVFSPNAFILKGNIKPFASELRALGGVYNKKADGWVYNNKKEVGVDTWLSSQKTRHQEPVSGAEESGKANDRPGPQKSNYSDVLRKQADSLQKTIDEKRNPATANQTPTARRRGILDGMAQEADRLERYQKAMRRIADDMDAGTLPESLKDIKSKAQIEQLEQLVRQVQGYADRAKPVTPEDIRSKARFGVMLHDTALNELLEATKGKPGTAEARNYLTYRQRNRMNYILESDKGAEALKTLLDKAGEAFRRKTEVKETIAEYNRLRRLGVTDTDSLSKLLTDFLPYRQVKPSVPSTEARIKQLSDDVILSKPDGFFPTPKAIIDDMLAEADIGPGMDVLEPSAGLGHIADAIKAEQPRAVLTTIEPNSRMREVLGLKGHNLPEEGDFLNHKGQYDRIVMNPPFEKGQDIDHVRHAYSLLKPGGKVVAIMSEGPFFRNDKKATGFRDWLVQNDFGFGKKLSDKSFGKADVPTGVATRMIVLEKPEASAFEQSRPFAAKKTETTPSREGRLLDEYRKKYALGRYSEAQVLEIIRNNPPERMPQGVYDYNSYIYNIMNPGPEGFRIGDIVDYKGERYEVGHVMPSDRGGTIRLQDPETHQGNIKVGASDLIMIKQGELWNDTRSFDLTAPGKKSKTKTITGTQIETQLGIVDARSLVTSHKDNAEINPSFPKELQPMDRERTAIDLQISDILNKLEPEWLGDNPQAWEGSPIIDKAGNVEVGNGRTMALRRGYKTGHDNIQKYKEWLNDPETAKRFGYDLNAVKDIKEPVLVRIRLTDVSDLGQWVRDANESATSAMSQAEQAQADVKNLTEGSYLLNIEPPRTGALLSGKNLEVAAKFIRDNTPKSAIGEYSDAEGNLNQAGVARFRNAILAAAYGKNRAIEGMIESTHDDIRTITAGLTRAAPMLAKAKALTKAGKLPDRDITADISEAAAKARDAYDANMTIQKYLDYLDRQSAFFPEIEGIPLAVLKMFNENRKSGIAIGNVLVEYAKIWAALEDPSQGKLFELDTKIPDAGEMLTEAIRYAKETDTAGKDQVTLDGFMGEAGRDAATKSANSTNAPRGEPPTPSGEASTGGFADIELDPDTPTPPGFNSTSPDPLPYALELPEIVQLAKELMGGKYPKVLKRLRGSALGRFSAKFNKPNIKIQASVAEDTTQLSKLLGHEIGHLIDWLPDFTLSRGNILGRIAVLRRFMGSAIPGSPEGLPPLTIEERAFLKEWAKLATSTRQEKIIDEVIRTETPLTPEDVLAVWNSTIENSDKINKELLDYIKGLNTAQKKEIVKAALQGRITQDLDRFKRIDERKTGKKIKSIVDVIDYPAMRSLYDRLIREEAEKRMILEAKQVRDELKAFTQRWSPFDDSISPKYNKYRYSSRELYADAISALVTNPGYLRRHAPNFYRGFFNYLEMKPEVKAEWEDLQNSIATGQNAEDRVKLVHEGFEQREQEWRDQIAQREENKQLKSKEAWGNTFIDKAYSIKSRARKAGDLTPYHLVDDYVYSASEVEGSMMEMKAQVIDRFAENGLTPELFGEYLFHRRITSDVGDRNTKANPYGFEPVSSAKRVAEMEKTWPALPALKDKFRALYKEWFVDKARDSEMYSDELMKAMEEWEDYATFDIVGHTEEAHGKLATGKIYRQVGTFSATGNPFTATLLKMSYTMKAINRNIASRAVTDMMLDSFPDEIVPADKRWVNNHNELIEPKDPDQELMVYMHKGEVKGYYVPKYIAQAFDANPYEGQLIATALRYLATPFRKVFTEYNPGFWAFNVLRDFKRLARNIPGGAYRAMLPYMTQAVKPAFRSTFGIPDAVIKDMNKNRALISVVDYHGVTPEDTMLERVLARYRLVPSVWNNRILAPIDTALNTMSNIGQALERVPKVAGWQYYKDNHPQISARERAFRVRGETGSPAFLRQGTGSPYYNNVFIFSNAMKEGWRADIDVVKRNKSEAAWKFARYSLIPKLLMFAGGIGLMGAVIKKIFDNVSDYDGANYNIIPLGTTSTGKAVYLRLPQDELGRFFGGVAWKMVTGDTENLAADLSAYMAGQAPGLNPAFGLLANVIAYASGKNPYDAFRGRDAIPDQVFEANDYRSRVAFAKYVANSAGGSVLHNFRSDQPGAVKSDIEKFLDLPVISNILGRFIKVTDYGMREDIRREKKKARELVARQSLDVKEVADRILAGEKITEADITKLGERPDTAKSRLKAGAAARQGVLQDELQSARSNEEKIAILNYAWRKGLLKELVAEK